MAKKTKLLAWTKDDIRTLKTMAREKIRTTVIARKLKRNLVATRQQTVRLGVALGGGRGKVE
jgi:hypothetical protein